MNTVTRWTAGAMVGSALALSATLSAQASELVVIEAVGNAGVEAGAIIESGASVTVPDGASITLIGQDGTPLVLTGPYTGVPETGAGSGSSNMDVLAGLFGGSSKSTASLGVVRDAGTNRPIKLPDPYVVEVTRAGDRCIGADGAVTLYRSAATGRAEPLELSKLISGNPINSMKASWPANKTKLNLPASVASQIKSGDTWRVSVGKNKADLTFHAMPGSLANATQKAIWLANNNCNPQAIALLNSLR